MATKLDHEDVGVVKFVSTIMVARRGYFKTLRGLRHCWGRSDDPKQKRRE